MFQSQVISSCATSIASANLAAGLDDVLPLYIFGLENEMSFSFRSSVLRTQASYLWLHHFIS